MPLNSHFYVFGGSWDGDFHMCGIMSLLRAVLNMLMENASPRGHMCFRCLMISLSGPYELLFSLCYSSWTCVVVSLMLYPCIFLCSPVNESV